MKSVLKQRFFIFFLLFFSRLVIADGLIVSSSEDAGENSFRAAVLSANSNPLITEIYFNVSEPIQLLSSVQYLGTQTLALFGNGVHIDGSRLKEFDLFVSKTGASLSFNQMTFTQSPARMIAIRIPATAIGTVTISLKDVSIQRAGQEGLYISDREVFDNEVFIGSPASIKLHIENSIFNENGLQGVAGADGVRVLELGEGSLIAEITHSIMNGNGRDGLDLSESEGGDIDIYGHHLEVNGNGFFDPESPEDGISLNETGLGNMYISLKSVKVNNNRDEGMDIRESEDGHILLALRDIEGNQNGDESLRLDESGFGYIDATFFNMTSLENGDDGIQIRETNEGRLHLNFTNFNASGNEKNGVRIEQFGDNDEIDSIENEGRILNGDGNILENNLIAPFLLRGVSVR